MISNLFNSNAAAACTINERLFDNKINVSNSVKDPKAILRKWRNSFCDFRPAPSAMLAGIEIADRRICDTSPNFSLCGKEFVKL